VKAGADQQLGPCIFWTEIPKTATWSKAGQLDWWVKERQEWWGRVRGAGGRPWWIKAVDLRPAEHE
jgi:hypothetical protein